MRKKKQHTKNCHCVSLPSVALGVGVSSEGDPTQRIEFGWCAPFERQHIKDNQHRSQMAGQSNNKQLGGVSSEGDPKNN